MNFKEASKKNYYNEKSKTDKYPGDMEIIIGCCQRIADASEAMAENHIKLQKDYEYLQERYKNTREFNLSMVRSNSALRGVITKLKNNNEKHSRNK